MRFRSSKTRLRSPSNPQVFFSTDRRKAVAVLQFFVCASVVSYVTLVVVIICCLSLLRLLPREGCVSFPVYLHLYFSVNMVIHTNI